MKRASLAIVMPSLLVLVFPGCAFKPFKGETIVSPRFTPEAKNKAIALVCEVSNPDALQLWYLPHLTQALIRNGYTVIGRKELDQILKELDIDQIRDIRRRGWYAQKGEKEAGGKEIDIGIFTPSKLKQIGRLYGIDYVGVYGQWPNKRAYFRMIDCETAEVVATTLFSVPNYPQAYPEWMTAYGMKIHNTPQNTVIYTDDFPHNTADLLVLSLKYASKVKDSQGNPRMVYLDISREERKEGKSRGVEKILFQEKIRCGATPMYATVSTIDYELADD